MREKINRLAKGIIDRDEPMIRLHPERFDDVIPSDTKRKYDLIIDSDSGLSLKGLCYSDDADIGLETRAFMGRRCHVVFYADTSFKAPGSEITGALHLITNAGEFSIPYRFEVASMPDQMQEALQEESAEEADISASDVNSQDILKEDAAYPVEPETSLEDAAADEEETVEGEFLRFILSNLPEDDELLEELCGILINGDRTDGFAFSVYKEAVARDIELTRLYEYYIYAYPDELHEEMPRSVLLYFSYDNTLDPERKALIYENVLLYQDKDSELFASYEPQIRDLCMSALFERRIDERLAVIYDHVLYPNMIDRKAAEILPDILKSCRISLEDERVRSVVLHFPELAYEERFPVKKGAAYVPVYFEDTEIGFADRNGRVLKDIAFKKESLLERPDLLRRCFEIYPDHPMLKLAAARNVLKKGVENDTEAEILRDSFEKLRLSLSFREEIIKALCKREGGSATFRSLDLDPYGSDIRSLLFHALLYDGYFEDAYLKLRRYGLSTAESKDLSVLAVSLIKTGSIPTVKGETDTFFMALCKEAFDAGCEDREVLEFLCRAYEGPTDEMLDILRRADALSFEVYELPEKVLTAKLFASSFNDLDESFEIYIRRCEQKEAIIRAYLTIRCDDYFEREDDSLPDQFFEILYSYVSSAEDYGKLPDIYLLALTKHYEEKDRLLDDEAELCQKLCDILIGQGLIFRYTKALKKKISIPKEICERYYIEYHGDRDSAPRLYVKISPEDDEYHREEMVRVYGGIYVMSTILFVEDELHYMIYDDSISDSTVQEGSISVKKLHSREEDRYSMLDRMTKELKEARLSELQEDLKNYILTDGERRGLFEIRE